MHLGWSAHPNSQLEFKGLSVDHVFCDWMLTFTLAIKKHPSLLQMTHLVMFIVDLKHTIIEIVMMHVLSICKLLYKLKQNVFVAEFAVVRWGN